MPTGPGSAGAEHRPDLASAVEAITPNGDGAPIAPLLDVQFWLLGRDVEHPDGNLLVRSGFARDAARGTPTRYRLDTADEQVVLWPCGLFLATAGTATLALRGDVPVDAAGLDPLPLRKLDAVLGAHGAGGPCSPATLAGLCGWFARYEASVRTTAGVAHRVPRPGPRPLLAPAVACSLENAWQELEASYLGQGATSVPAVR